jgi:hypothetical protein
MEVGSVLRTEPLSNLVDELDRIRLALGGSRDERLWRAECTKMRGLPACPFVGARPGTLSFARWLEWSKLDTLTEHEKVIKGRKGQAGEILVLEFPQRHLSLLLYYASYAYNLTVFPSSPDDYHTIVDEVLERLSRLKLRSLALELFAAPKPHSLFHRVYGDAATEAPTTSARLTVPAQYFFNNWLSVVVDGDVFRLHRSMPEFYWISWAYGSLDRVVLENARDVANLYALDATTIEELVVQASPSSLPDAFDLFGLANSMTMLTTNLPLEVGKSRLKKLVLQHIPALKYLPDGRTHVPLLDELYLEEVGGSGMDVAVFLRQLYGRTTKMQGAKGARFTAGFPKSCTVFDCFVKDGDLGSWLDLATTRTKTLSLGCRDIKTLPGCSSEEFVLDQLTLSKMPLIDASQVQRLARSCNPVYFQLEEMPLIAHAETLAEAMRYLTRLETCIFINLGIYNFTECLSDKATLKHLEILQDDLPEDVDFTIPYRSLPNLETQSGLLDDEELAEDEGLPLTPDSAAAWERQVRRLEGLARTLVFDEASRGADVSANIGVVIKTKTKAVLGYGYPLGTTKRPDGEDELYYPHWFPLDPQGELRARVLSSWAAWALEMDTWLTGNRDEGIFFYPKFRGLLPDIDRRRVLRKEDGAILVQYTWTADMQNNIDHQAAMREIETGFFEMVLRLVRRPRTIDRRVETGRFAVLYELEQLHPFDPRQEVRGHGIKVSVGENNYGILRKTITYVDQRFGVSFVLGELEINPLSGLTCTFELKRLIQFFALQSVAALLTEQPEKQGVFSERKLEFVWKQGNYAFDDEFEACTMLENLAHQVPHDWLETDPLILLSVTAAKERALDSEKLLRVYLMCVGLYSIRQEVKVTNSLFRVYLERIDEQFVAPVAKWIVAAEPVQVDRVDAIAVAADDDDDDDEGLVLRRAVGNDESPLTLFQPISNELFDLFDDIETGVYALFEQAQSDPSLWEDLITVFIVAELELLEGEESLDDDPLLRWAKFLDRFDKFRAELRNFDLSPELYESVRASINAMATQFQLLKDPFVQISSKDKKDDYDVNMIATYMAEHAPLSFVRERFEIAYAKSEDIIDLLLLLEPSSSSSPIAKQPSPKRFKLANSPERGGELVLEPKDNAPPQLTTVVESHASLKRRQDAEIVSGGTREDAVPPRRKPLPPLPPPPPPKEKEEEQEEVVVRAQPKRVVPEPPAPQEVVNPPTVVEVKKERKVIDLMTRIGCALCGDVTTSPPYCSKACQTIHWGIHKSACNP